MCSTACCKFAVQPISTGTLPGPTPMAGVPDEYADFTKPLPPVARISPTSGACMSACVVSLDGVFTA